MDGPDKILVSCSQPGNHTSASPGCKVTCSGCSTCGRGRGEGVGGDVIFCCKARKARPTPLSSFPLPPLLQGRATIFSSLPPARRLCWYTSGPCASWLHREDGPSVATHYLGRGGGSLTSQTLLALRRKKRGREGGRLSCKLGSFHSSAQIASKTVLKVIGTEEIVERVWLMVESGGGEGGVNEVCGRREREEGDCV